MIELEYGKSMYGGWYAHSYYAPYIFLKANTLKELKKKVLVLGTVCKLAKRVDNLGNGIL